MRRALVFGGHGLLGTELLRAMSERGYEVSAPPRSAPSGSHDRTSAALSTPPVDVTDRDAVRAAVRAASPEWVVNLAAFTDVNGAESRPDDAFRLNRDAAGWVAEAAADAGARTLHMSTDYVFDGTARDPYAPDARVSPLSTYGRSKAEGEDRVLGAGGAPLVVRTSWMYGRGGPNFVRTILTKARGGGPLRVVDDQRGRPTWTRSLSATLLDLMDRGCEGIFHAADDGDATWFDLATEAVHLAGIDARIDRTTTRPVPGTARRPAYSVLDLGATREAIGREIPSWTESLQRHLQESAALDTQHGRVCDQ